MKDDFETRLLEELKREVTLAAARDQAEAPEPAWRRLLTGRRLAIATTGVAAAACALVMLPGGADSPAYAVERHEDGTVSVELNARELSREELDGLVLDLHEAGLTTLVTPVDEVSCMDDEELAESLDSLLSDTLDGTFLPPDPDGVLEDGTPVTLIRVMRADGTLEDGTPAPMRPVLRVNADPIASTWGDDGPILTESVEVGDSVVFSVEDGRITDLIFAPGTCMTEALQHRLLGEAGEAEDGQGEAGEAEDGRDEAGESGDGRNEASESEDGQDQSEPALPVVD